MLLNDSRNEAFLCCEPSDQDTVNEQEWYTRKEAAKRLCYTVGSMAVYDSTGKYDFQPNKDRKHVRYPKAHIERLRLERLKVKKYLKKIEAAKAAFHQA